MKGDRGMSDSEACVGVMDLPDCWAFWRVAAHSPWFPVRNYGGKKSPAP